MPNSSDYRPRADRTGQPLAQVTCTRCGARFTSAAKTHTRCPGCGANNRVHREPYVRRPAAQRSKNPKPVARQKSPTAQQPVRQPEPFRIPPTPPIAAPVISADDDDGLAYVRDRGRLVLAAPDAAGRPVPATELPPDYLGRELPARRWRLQPHGLGVCHVIRTWPAVADIPADAEACQRPAEHGPLCAKCFDALRAPAP